MSDRKRLKASNWRKFTIGTLLVLLTSFYQQPAEAYYSFQEYNYNDGLARIDIRYPVFELESYEATEQINAFVNKYKSWLIDSAFKSFSKTFNQGRLLSTIRAKEIGEYVVLYPETGYTTWTVNNITTAYVFDASTGNRLRITDILPSDVFTPKALAFALSNNLANENSCSYFNTYTSQSGEKIYSESSFKDSPKYFDIGDNGELRIWYQPSGTFMVTIPDINAYIYAVRADRLAEKIKQLKENRKIEIENKKFADAIDTCTQIIELEPSNFENYWYRAYLYNNALKIYDLAIDDWNKAIELSPNNAILYENRSKTYSTIGNKQQALSDMNEAIKLDPQNKEYLKLRIDLNKALNNYEDAVKDYTELIALEPNNPDFYYGRAWIYVFKTKQYQSGKEDCLKVISINPQIAANHNLLAYAYIGLNEYDLALKSVKKADTISPRESWIYDTFGDVYAAMNKTKQAINWYNKALQLNPDQTESKEKLAQIEAKKLLAKQSASNKM